VQRRLTAPPRINPALRTAHPAAGPSGAPPKPWHPSRWRTPFCSATKIPDQIVPDRPVLSNTTLQATRVFPQLDGVERVCQGEREAPVLFLCAHPRLANRARVNYSTPDTCFAASDKALSGKGKELRVAACACAHSLTQRSDEAPSVMVLAPASHELTPSASIPQPHSHSDMLSQTTISCEASLTFSNPFPRLAHCHWIQLQRTSTMSPVSLRASLVAAVVAVATAQIPREFAKNVTVYHVNPVVYGVAPVNMNTADLLGDMYFDLRTKALPIEVRDAPMPLQTPPRLEHLRVGPSRPPLLRRPLGLLVDKPF
jgi:hypothetical protein